MIDAKRGQPIRKVTVEVMGGTGGSSRTQSVTTGADGSFSVEDVAKGRYIVMLQHAGYVQTAKNRGETTLTVQAGQNLTGLVFRMQAAGVIMGKILDVDGDPMPGVGVTATLTNAKAQIAQHFPGGSGGTNDLGEYRVADLRPGKYLITAMPPQREPAIQTQETEKTKEHLLYVQTYFPETLDKNQAAEVEVHSGEEAVANFGVQTSNAYRLSGSVTGVPSGALVEFMLIPKSGGGGANNPQQLKEGNRFEYQNVLPGTYVAMMMVIKRVLTGGQPEMQIVPLSPSIEDSGEKFDWTLETRTKP